jgi:hypothetical protein
VPEVSIIFKNKRAYERGWLADEYISFIFMEDNWLPKDETEHSEG